MTSSDLSIKSEVWLESLIGICFAIIFFGFCLLNFNQNIECVFQSSDTAWLTETGRYILRHGIPSTDPFSWTNPNKPIVVYQWLFTVVSAFIFNLGGLWLLGLVFAILCAITCIGLLSNQMLSQQVKPVYVFGFLSLISTPAWFWARPQSVSFLLIVVFTYLLEQNRIYGYRKTIWLLPLLMVLWVNTHSFWFIGLMMVAFYFAKLLNQRRYAYLLLLCLMAVLVNPYGAEIVGYNLSFLTEPDFGKISELQPSLLRSPQNYFSIWLYLILAWIFIILGRSKVPLAGLALGSFATGLALLFYRFVPVAILLTWPYLSLALNQLSFFRDSSKCKNLLLAMPVVTILSAAIIYVMHFPLNQPVWFTHSNSNLDAINYLKQHPEMRKQMLCSPALGCSQILENLGPVFIDTRFDFYGRQFCSQYNNCIQAQDGWQAYLQKWKIQSLGIEDTFPIYRELKLSRKWLSVYDDGNYSFWVQKK